MFKINVLKSNARTQKQSKYKVVYIPHVKSHVKSHVVAVTNKYHKYHKSHLFVLTSYNVYKNMFHIFCSSYVQ